MELQTASAYVRSHTNTAYLDFGATTAVQLVVDSASNLNVLANNASSDIIQNGGVVTIASNVQETATFGDINKKDGTLTVGTGVTLTTLNSDSGGTTLKTSCTTLNVLKGSTTTTGEGAITTMNIADSGTVFANSSGTVTTVNLSGNGTLDLTKSLEARTFTTINLDDTCTLKYDESYVTITTLAVGTFTKPRQLKIT